MDASTVFRSLWPSLSKATDLPRLPSGTLHAENVVHEYANKLLDRQSSDYDALDTKAATLIGAVLVFAGLLFPNLTPDGIPQWSLTALLVALLGYTLATYLAAYNVSVLHGSWTPAVAIGVLPYKENTARTALTYATLQAYLSNKPTLDRKAQFVRLSVYSLPVAAALTAGLFAAGAFS